MSTEDLALPGRHNVYNSLAAAMAARVMEVRTDSIRESLMTFEGVKHRLELVRELDRVDYVNDSKATNVNAVWYALESYDKRVILIAGGRDKGMTTRRSLIWSKQKVYMAWWRSENLPIGCFRSWATSHPSVLRADSMGDAVLEAHRIARPGDVVLLSPACASFDMFANFEERGDAFRRAVEDLRS